RGRLHGDRRLRRPARRGDGAVVGRHRALRRQRPRPDDRRRRRARRPPGRRRGRWPRRDGGAGGRWRGPRRRRTAPGDRAAVGRAVERGAELRFGSAEPGSWFGPACADVGLKGIHGGLATRAQVAIVAGGHPAVPRLAAGLAARVPEAPDWAVTVAELLDLE